MVVKDTDPFFIRRNALRILRPPQVLNVAPLNSMPYIDPNANAAHQESHNGRAQPAQPSLLLLLSQPTEEEVSRVLSAANNATMLSGSAAMGMVGPVIGKMNIAEDDDAYIFRVSLPGVARDEFSCNIAPDGQILIKGITTTGEKVVYKDSMKFEMVTQNLCPPGHFTISFKLPGPVDSQDLAGVFGINGVFEGIVKNLLEEVTDELAEKRTQIRALEEYVSTLKSMVGIRALVEAIGIGKGKEDLTTAVKNNSNSGPRKRVRAPELPPGNAFASHSSEDIIKLLTGDLRQSKTRSNNLFWGAVWPRLLAKGWHSKQDNCIDTAPRSGLIFLKPGIKKLSKSKYLNGVHYFDSISDVLSKVVSEPQLLDLPTDEEVGSENFREQSDGLATKLQKDTKSPRYLKPRVVEELMEFTVIDTSSPSRVRELKGLPDEKGRSSVVVSRCQRKRKHPLGDSNVNTMETSLEAVTGAGASKEPSLKQEDQLNGSLPSDQQVRTIKHKFSSQEKADISTHVDPDQDVHTHTPVSPCDGKSEAVAQPQVLIDLNLPHEPMESMTIEQPTGQCNAAAKAEAIESSTSGGEISEEVPNASTRRLSTRKRPLTAKAREALEDRLLRAKQRKKRPPARSLDREAGSPRQARSDGSDL